MTPATFLINICSFLSCCGTTIVATTRNCIYDGYGTTCATAAVAGENDCLQQIMVVQLLTAGGEGPEGAHLECFDWLFRYHVRRETFLLDGLIWRSSGKDGRQRREHPDNKRSTTASRRGLWRVFIIILFRKQSTNPVAAKVRSQRRIVRNLVWRKFRCRRGGVYYPGHMDRRGEYTIQDMWMGRAGLTIRDI